MTSTLLWATVAAFVAPHKSELHSLRTSCDSHNNPVLDTCDLTWQSTRDGLIISAHLFSDFSLILILILNVIFATRTSCKLIVPYIVDSMPYLSPSKELQHDIVLHLLLQLID